MQREHLFETVMESIPNDLILEINSNTVTYLRKQNNLDKPGRMEEAIDILEEWVKKQNHFMVKAFPRDYLERTIIISKGSVERAKTKLDRICMFRTMFPNFFNELDLKNCTLLDTMHGTFLPKLTEDHNRVFLFQCKATTIKSGLLDCYRYLFMQCEYMQTYDCSNRLVAVIDYTEAHIMELLKWFNPGDLREAIMVLKEGYGMRIKGIHLISGSNAMNAIVSIFKQALSAKLVERLYVHKDMTELSDYIDKDIIPIEYGGKEKPLNELHKKYLEVLTSDGFTAYLKEMNKACTNEKLRGREKFLGIPGSFRTLCVE